MSEDNLAMKPYKGWETVVLRILKWLAIFAVIILIGLTILSRLGGNSPVLREAVEEFLTEATPYTAHVGTLNTMRFFPDIMVDATDIELRAGDDGTGEAMVHIGSARIVMPFFDAMFRPGYFKTLHIENLKALPGAILDKNLAVQSLAVKDDQEEPALIIEGAIDTAPFYARFGLQAKGRPGDYVYVIGHERGFEMKLADIDIRGTLRNTVTGDYKFANFTLKKNDVEVLHGNIDLDRSREHRLGISGSLSLEPGKSLIDPDVTLSWSDDIRSVNGKITASELAIEDITGTSPLQQTIDTLDKILGDPTGKIDMAGWALDLNLDVEKLKTGKIWLGKIKTPLILKDSQLHAGPLSGTVMMGALSGDINLDASKSPATLTQKISIKGFDYTELQKRLSDQPANIEGHGDILIDLSSESQTMDGLIDGLSGKMGFIGGQGKMRAGLLDLWGGGLLNALLPSFEKDSDLNMNCVVVNLDVKDLKGQSDSVFIDTKRVTLHGEGTYDFKNDQLEMVLEPKSKGVAIGDISSAVNVSGPLSDLKTSPNVFDLGKRVGGLLLGAVNPVFYAVTLADFALADDHPCKAYVIEKETLAEPVKPAEVPAPEAEPKQDESPAAEMEQRTEEMNE